SVAKTTMGRRSFLLGAAAASTVSTLAAPAIAKGDDAYEGKVIRTLEFVHNRTDERFKGVYWWEGEYQPEALQRANWTLRDVNLDIGRDMDPGLLDFMYGIKQKMGKHEMVVTSAYRTKHTNDRLRRKNRLAARRSLHIEGQAVDFYSPKLYGSTIGKMANSLEKGGVGRYKGRRFIHVDVGPVRTWYR
ncbi:MAG: DUF5715 family protein, partial [Pseudomonadota bacterium]